MANDNAPRGGGGRRPRSPTRHVSVLHVDRLTPRLTRITFGGDQLAGFGPPRPGAHMKLLFVPEGSDWSPDDEAAPRPPRRTYTPRRYDPDALELDIEFVHHGEGLAANWAQRAKSGQSLYINGPGGGYEVPEDASDVVLLADETALPAAATILEALPSGCRPHLFCEVVDAADERVLSPVVDSHPIWLHRADQDAVPGSMLEQAVRDFKGSASTAHWWIACEASAMRRIRTYLLRDAGVDVGRVHTRGYWKLGETAYPDHDYGKD